MFTCTLSGDFGDLSEAQRDSIIGALLAQLSDNDDIPDPVDVAFRAAYVASDGRTYELDSYTGGGWHPGRDEAG